MNICEPEVATLKTIGELLVIDAEAMENGRILIMNVNRILDHVVAIVIRFAISDAAFNAAASHPN